MGWNGSKEKSSRDVQLGVTHGGLLKAQRPWGTFSLGLEAGRFAGPGRTVASRMCVDKDVCGQEQARRPVASEVAGAGKAGRRAEEKP